MFNNEDWYKHTNYVLKIQYFITFIEKTCIKKTKKTIKLNENVTEILKYFFLFTV